MPDAMGLGYNALDASHMIEMICEDISELTLHISNQQVAVAINMLTMLNKDLSIKMRAGISRGDLASIEFKRDKVLRSLVNL